MSKLDEPGRGENRFAQPVAWVPYPPEDEISLLDLWRTLSRRRWWIAITFVIFIIAGLAYALLVPLSYEYTTVINVGTRMDSGGNTQALTAPDALAALATNAVIPTVLGDYAAQHTSGGLYKIGATHPQSSNLVVLSAKGPTSRREALTALERQIAQKLLDISTRRAKVLRQQFSQQAQAGQARVKSLQDALDQLREGIASQPRNDALHIQRSQTKLDLAQALSDLAQTQGQLSALTPPQLSAVSIQSQEPVGLSDKLAVIMAAIIGFFVGVVLALFADFVGRANAS